MPVETKLALRGLSRDVNGYVADQAGALRKAENVVLRAQDTAESRPNFDMYYESVFTSQRCKALVEFGGEPIAVEFDGSTWGLRRLSTNTGYVNGSLAQPVNYDQAEPQFAEAKKNLYGLGASGVYALSSVTDTTNGLRYAGLEMIYCTDMVQYSNATGIAAGIGPCTTWAYCFVYKRTDANGNVLRSPPSERLVQAAQGTNNAYVTPTRFYFNPALVAGDQVEVYRSRATSLTSGAMPAPLPTMYLAYTYTLTPGDVLAGYFVPPSDSTTDDQLGAELYTNSTQQGVVAAKYPPPRAQTLALWQRCMWYGRTVSKNRLSLQMLTAGPAGLTGDGGLRDAWNAGYTSGSPNVSLVSGHVVTQVGTARTSLSPGMRWSDNYLGGPAAAGTAVPANTTIASITDGTHIVLSNNATATVTSYGGVMGLLTKGIWATTTKANFTSGSPIVTGIPSTTGLRAGMYITDSANGPTIDGAKVPKNTTILSVDSTTQVTMSANASATGSGLDAYYGDIITITPQGGAVKFYPFAGSGAAGWSFWSGPAPFFTSSGAPWTSTAPQCFPFTSSVPLYGQLGLRLVVYLLSQLINYWALTHPTTFKVRCVPVGDVWLDNEPMPTSSASFVLEEMGVGQSAFTVSSTTIANAFSPTLTATSTNDDKPNRLWWSAPDEPEAVPLLNYQDIGSSSEPILALVPLRNALLVFKTDGIWRVTGSAPSSWSIEPLDLAIRLLRPEAVTNIGDGAYAWCDRGMFLVTDSGAQSLSSNAIDVELRTAANYILTNATTHGTFMVPWKARNLVLFGIPAAAAGTTTQRVYAFSTVTNAFSEWPVSWSVACHGDGDAVYYSRPYDGTVLYEVRKSATAVRGYDRLYAISSATAVGTTVTISQSITGAWEPAVGDILTAIVGGDPTYGRRITAVASGGGNWTLTIESAFPAGSTSGWTAYEVPVITLEWHPTAVSGLPMGGFCREMQVHLDLRDAGSRISGTIPTSWALGGTSEAVTTPSTVTSTRALTAQIQPIRVGMSRKVARGAALAGYFSAGDLFPMRVLGASLVFDGTSERTRK